MRVGLDLSFSFRRAIPRTEIETAVFDFLLKLFVIVAREDIVVEECLSLLKDVLLHFLKQIFYVVFNAFKRNGFLFERVATHDFNGAVFQVSTSHDDSDRNTLQFVVGKFKSGALVVCIIVFHTNAHRLQTVSQAAQFFIKCLQFVFSLINGHNDHLYWSDVWRKYQTVVV